MHRRALFLLSYQGSSAGRVLSLQSQTETKKTARVMHFSLFYLALFQKVLSALGSEIVLPLPLGYPQDLQVIHELAYKNVKLSLNVSRFVSRLPN